MYNTTIPKTMQELKEETRACYKCDIANKRIQIVFGDGLDKPHDAVLIGEGPGESEDRKGHPFVGVSGQYLNTVLEDHRLYRGTDYAVLNVLCCRPINNAKPAPEQTVNCRPFLEAKIKYLKPKIILLVGGTAANAIIGNEESISSIRGKIFTVTIGNHTCKAIPTFHPSYLLRNRGKFPEDQFLKDVMLFKKILTEEGN